MLDAIVEVLRGYYPYTSAGFFILTLLLLRFVRHERRSVLITAGFFLLCLAGLGVSSALHVPGARDLARWSQIACVFGLGAAVIRQATIAIFFGLLPAVRLSTPHILQDLSAAALYIVWAVVLLEERQADLTGILTTSAVVTAVLAFSLQDTLGNILGGVALQLDRSLAAGDWIKVDDLVGRVVDIRWRYVAIETRNWETVVVPNSQLLKSKFIVLGRRQGQPLQLRRLVWFNVDFRFSPARVIEIADRAIRSARIDRVAATPAPNCVLMGFGESYGKYVMRYWLTDLAIDDPTDSEVRTHLYFGLKREGIPLSIPAHAVFLTEESREHEKGKEERDRKHRLDALAGVSLFSRLTSQEMAELADRLVPTPFAAGDVVTRQGAEAHWLYIIIRGQADVVIEDRDGHSIRVAKLSPGDCVGEMGLLTGEPRTATVVAQTEVECYKLDKRSFQKILELRPAVADDLSQLLARRRLELESALGNLDATAKADRLAHAQSDILGKIRRFFSLED